MLWLDGSVCQTAIRHSGAVYNAPDISRKSDCAGPDDAMLNDRSPKAGRPLFTIILILVLPFLTVSVRISILAFIFFVTLLTPPC